ncbi:kinesin-like protein KIN-UB isoform X2 [Iris pallida]|uniref:Kinesin-like protein KIN-UB isoform X2 n=1 Tax=Iris pallida TaxID=29817 RepID=A0AAX6ETX4_IRIPA|nr:kinesin-like protein KIN-UB isoform X2 [Iris pallida]
MLLNIIISIITSYLFFHINTIIWFSTSKFHKLFVHVGSHLYKLCQDEFSFHGAEILYIFVPTIMHLYSLQSLQFFKHLFNIRFFLALLYAFNLLTEFIFVWKSMLKFNGAFVA